MKKLIPLVLCSTTAAICLAAVSACAGYLTPRVPPPAISQPAARPAGELGYAPRSLTTVWTVTSVKDSGAGSLREAIGSAAAGDTVDFALTLPATIVLSNTLVIATDVAVLGPGPDQLTVMRSDAPGTPDFRVFQVETGVVTLAGMTIRNGSAFSGTNIHDNLGGGILNQGILTVSNCVVTGNRAPTTDWGTTNSVGFGAGIFTYPGSQLSVINSTISDNWASGAGGALCTWHADRFSAVGSTFSSNFAAVQGGALNLQGRVGAFQNCTIAGNSTLPDGAGSAFLAINYIDEITSVTFTACTIGGNLGSTNGACILARLSNLGLTNKFLSTLVASNASPNFLLEGNPVLVSLGHNLDSDGTSGLVNGANGDLVGTQASPIDSKLGPLQNNGGPTLTMALLPGSPALNVGSCVDANGSPVLVDQRGLPRPQGGGCDIGAYEFQPLTLTCPPGVVVEFQNESGAVVTYSAVASSSCSNVTVVYTPPSGTMFPIGVTPVLVQATDSCTNSAQCSFNVTVLGAQGVKSNVLAELIALRASTNFSQPLAQKLDDAIRHLAASLDPAYWIDQTHLQPGGGNTAMNEEKLAVNKLLDIRDAKDCPVAPAVLQGYIDRIVKSDRLLAVISIQDAANAGLNPKKIAEDLAMVAKGDAEAAAGRYVNAIEHYRNAWRHAVQLRLKVGLAPDGSTRVQFIGNNSQSYRIEVSTDMAHWVPLGTCRADVQGDVQFTDRNTGAQPLRFYRALEQ